MAAADLLGPTEIFSRATIPAGHDSKSDRYAVVTIGINTGFCLTESGIAVKPRIDLENAPPLDTIIVPGGTGVHHSIATIKMAGWLKEKAPFTRRIGALGTGVYALAATGLLDNREVVCHWRFAKDLAARFPKIRVTASNIFAHDGPFYTCAGGSAAIDFSLALVEEDHGRQASLNLARELVVHHRRAGCEEQYAEPLRFQVQSIDRFADLPAWISTHLDQDLSVEALAHKACMSRRNFTRLFSKSFGKTPSRFVAEVRMAEARRRVLIPRNNLEAIASSLGFTSADVFSQAFERSVGVRPSVYRAAGKAFAQT